MVMVFRLERHRGISPGRFLFGTDCGRSNPWSGKASQESETQKLHTEIQSRPEQIRQRRKNQIEQEALAGYYRCNQRQRKAEETKVAQTKEKGVTHGI